MIVGEAPSTKAPGSPLSPTSSWALDQLLSEAGLPPAFTTCVLREPNDEPEGLFVAASKRTEGHSLHEGKWTAHALLFGRNLLLQEILLVRPTVVIALGEIGLWALTGKSGIRDWRGSVLQGEVAGHYFKIIPGHHPATFLREYPLRKLALHDLQRAKRALATGPMVPEEKHKFIIRPSFAQVKQTLLWLQTCVTARKIKLSGDIETRGGHIACLGLGWSKTEAICIPFMCVERPDGYWTFEEEVEIVQMLRRILAHPNADITWQNGAYDHQYEWRWHFVLPRLGWDTMLAHHSMFSVDRKGLGHLSSLYCKNHAYWKDDGRLWDPKTMSEDAYWYYNCEDCVRTFEIREGQEAAIRDLTPTWPELPSVVQFQHDLQPAVVRMMLRGVRSDDVSRSHMAQALFTRIGELEKELFHILGREVNFRSPQQMVDLFYRELNQVPIYSRGPGGTRGNPTCNEDALLKIAERQPLLRGVVSRILAIRSAGVFLSTFVKMPRDIDGRLRCSYNVAGTKTYRFSSAENAFGSGGNLQNVPAGDESEEALVQLPNIRRLFLFDPGMTGFDLDGDSADLRIVTGESGCRQMQAYFAAKAKPYVEIAREFYRDQTITKHHPSYKRMKALCHGSNYGGEPAGLSVRIGLPVHDVERIQKWYFGMCPEIAAWQADIRAQIEKRGYIQNPFGYRLYNWDRISRQVFNEALAWTPQSTVGILINRILLAIDRTLPEVQLLLQVHDSLTGQYPSHLGDSMKARILSLAESVEIPCKSGPIRVPAGIKTSSLSWGHCE